MKLYKFMSPSTGKKFLQSTELRITPNSCLNDPFEVKLSSSTKVQVDSLDKNQRNINDKGISEKLEEFMNGHGIISLTESHDNLLMWAHYGVDHKGIVVEFDFDTNMPFSIFNVGHISTESDIQFGRVVYRKKRGYPNAITPNDLQTIAQHYYLTKSDEWIYEKEYRFIMPFTMATKVLVDTSKPMAKQALQLLGIKFKDKDEILDVSMEMVLNPDFELKKEIFSKSNVNGFMYFISIKDSHVSCVFLGVNSKDSDFTNIINDKYYKKISRSVVDRKYYGLLKGKVDDDRFEIQFSSFAD